MTTFFAWSVPAFFQGSLVDHTWVTTYDNENKHYANIGQVIAAGENCWFCWGSYHPQGGVPGNPSGALGNQSGSLTLAKCLVKPNADSRQDAAARGTIFTYGIDGVCHQLANQVLYATRRPTAAPLTVKLARGYTFSTLIYSTYGLQHAAWNAKILSCGGVPPSARPQIQGGATVTGLPDDFETRAREVLVEDRELLAELLKLKSEIQTYTALRVPGFEPPTPAALNLRNQHFLDQVALLLGDEKFLKLFGFPAGTIVNLVDPDFKQPE